MREARAAVACLTVALLGACSEPNDGPRTGGAGSGAAAGAGTGGAGGMAGVAGAGMAGSEGGDAGAGGEGTLPTGSDLGSLTVESVATWRGDSKGAYTIIHDDICDYPIDSLFDVAEPELTKRELPSAFGAIVQRCEERKLWQRLETLRQHGHEIINHSWTHPDFVVDAATISLDEQIDHANDVLNANLVGQKTSFFIFPFDSFDDTDVARVAALGYLGARAGLKGVNAADFPDGMRVMFDVYGGENSIYDGQGDILKIYVDLAISEGGWSVREFHGIADTTFFAMNLADYQAHLDYVKSKVDSGELWVDTPSAVVRYRFARQYCGLPTAGVQALSFVEPSADCLKFAAPLSVVVTTSVDAPSGLAQQQGAALSVKKLGPTRFLVDIDPSRGPAIFGGGD